MSQLIAEKNKALVLEAFETLFNKRDYGAAARYWSHGTIVAEGNFVIVHGRFSNLGLPVNWIAADVVRLEDGMLVEHWDVIQDEAARAQSKSGNPMFGSSFPE